MLNAEANLLTVLCATIARHGMFSYGHTVVVGASGGPDSTALLHALALFREEWGLSLVACHVNHGIRGAESDADAAYVQELCDQLQVECRVEQADVPAIQKRRHVSMQQAARDVRHTLLRQVASKAGAERIALAHTRDDRTETVLLNILRGGGLEGLSGFAPVALPLVRPLYDVTRAQVERYCAEHGLHPRQDSSNTKTTYRRNRIRLELLPQLRTDYNPHADEALLRLADLARDDNALLEQIASEMLVKLLDLDRNLTPNNLHTPGAPQRLKSPSPSDAGAPKRGWDPNSPSPSDAGAARRGWDPNSPSPSDAGAARRGVGVRYFQERDERKDENTLALPLLEMNALPIALRRRVLRQAIAQVRGHLQDIAFEILETFLAACKQQTAYSVELPSTNALTIRLRCDGQQALIAPTRAPVSPIAWEIPIPVPGRTFVPQASVIISANACSSWDAETLVRSLLANTVINVMGGASAEAIAEAGSSVPPVERGGFFLWAQSDITLPLVVRSWMPGDRMRPRGLNGTKKLQDIFTEAGIPASVRGRIPVLVDDAGRGRVLAVGELRVDASALFAARLPDAELSLKQWMLSAEADATKNQELFAIAIKYE